MVRARVEKEKNGTLVHYTPITFLHPPPALRFPIQDRRVNCGILGNLDGGVPTSPALCFRTSERAQNPGDVVALHTVGKMLLQKGFVLVSEAADLYAATKIEFLEDLQSSYPATHGSIFVPSKEQSISTRRGWACLLASSLSVIQVPVRLRDVSVGSSRREDWGCVLAEPSLHDVTRLRAPPRRLL